MKKLRANRPIKALCALLCVLVASLAFWSSIFTLGNWDDLWSGGDFYHSYSIYSPLGYYRQNVYDLMDLRMEKEWSGTLSYSDQKRLEALEELLDPANTNFRYQVHDQKTSALLDDSMGVVSPDSLAANEGSVVNITYGDYFRYMDSIRADDSSGRDILEAYVPQGSVSLDAGDYRAQYCPYGYWSDGGEWSGYNQAYDTRYRSVSIAVDAGVAIPLTVRDQFWEAREDYTDIQQFLPGLALTALVTLLLSAWLLIFLCRAAGHRDPEPDKVTPTWHDRIPTDVYAALYVCLFAVILNAGDAAAYSLNQSSRLTPLVGVGLFTLLGVAATLAAILTSAVRLKTGTFLKSMLLWRACAAVARALGDIFDRQNMNRRVIWLFLLYLLGSVLTGATLILIPVYQGFVLWLLCRWVREWRAIRAGTAAIVGGAPGTVIDTRGMRRFPDLKEHAGQLNDLGSAISNAVDEQLKSERFKAELITNVSHDLKTPLTSIINYVDLLKKEDIQDPKALEYIEVLDRKSQRLKKLTEDLVEASKASTGTLNVEKGKLGFTQLLTQALGEYEEKFEKSALSPVLTSPDHELYVEADGRHLWRVIDNLLGNCVKYAMPGTRVYLDVKSWDGSVTLSVKNVSNAPLNIPAEQLMERFVRGEESRTTEGSGLGLSIARSLTELQGGTFRLDIDGDLFKAVVCFPEYREPLPLMEGDPQRV